MKTSKKILVVIGTITIVLLIVILASGIYDSIKNAEQPAVFTIANDTNNTVKVYDCLTRDNSLQPGRSGTVQAHSKFPRGASCEIEDENSGERIGCLFAPQPVKQHDTILVSNLQPDVPSWECGIPR